MTNKTNYNDETQKGGAAAWAILTLITFATFVCGVLIGLNVP